MVYNSFVIMIVFGGGKREFMLLVVEINRDVRVPDNEMKIVTFRFRKMSF